MDHGQRTASRVIARAAEQLAEAGIASPRVDAELLAAHVLGVARGRLALIDEFTKTQLAELERLLGARRSAVPLQHLTGTAGFRHLDLAVGPGVFIPRPETELLVEWGLRWLGPHHPSPTVVDLCAGSGAIALSVAAELPEARVYAVERDPSALEWLRRNASGSSVRVVAGGATDPATLAELDGRVDLVLSNPPYVPEAVTLPEEVRAHDPHQAVFAGPDGLAVITPLIGRVAVLLRAGGGFGVEHDETHGASVPALLRGDGRFGGVEPHRDLAGRPRFATALRTAGPTAGADEWQDGDS